jgi:HAD superfamily hydrolase (TIGR01450 family)
VKRRGGEFFGPAPYEAFTSLASRHAAVVFDLEGTLLRGGRPVAGAVAAIDALRRAGTPWVIATNDASRSPERVAHDLTESGLPEVAASSIFTAGSLVGPFLTRRGLAGVRCLVLGPTLSHDAVALAGGVPVAPTQADPSCAVIVLTDESGFDLAESLDVALGLVAVRASRRLPTHLVLPNADVVVPIAPASAGVRAWAHGPGAFARLLRDGVRRVGASQSLAVHVLGKPRPPLFRAALAELSRRVAVALAPRQVVMVGDRLETDVAGARAFGFTAALAVQVPDAGVRSGRVRPDVVTTLSAERR